jgi:hypothetical protein
MYKLRIHRFIWLPYFVGRTWLGILFLVFLIVAGVVTGPLVSALQFQIALPATIPIDGLYLLGLVCVGINVVYLLLKSRPDYLTLRIASLPTLLTYIVLSLVVLAVAAATFAKSAPGNGGRLVSASYTKTLVVAGSQLSLVVLLMALSKFLNADAIDLDAIGTLMKKLTDEVSAVCRSVAGTKEFAQHHQALRDALDGLEKALDPAPNLALAPDIPAIVQGIKALKAFDETADDTALKRELSTKPPHFLQAVATVIGRRS